MINIFHGQNLDETFENACSQTLADYQMDDCQINYLNHEYVLVIKTKKVTTH